MSDAIFKGEFKIEFYINVISIHQICQGIHTSWSMISLRKNLKKETLLKFWDGVQSISVTDRKLLLCGSLNMATIHGWTLAIRPDVSS